MKKALIDTICLNLKHNQELLLNNKSCFYEEDLEFNNQEVSYDEVAVDNAKVVDNNFDEDDILMKFNSGSASLKEYKLMGAYKVNSENIDDINQLLKGKGIIRKGDIKKEANSAAINLIRINEGNGTIFNYKKFKIDIVSNYLSIINESILKYRSSLGKNLSVSQIREHVTNTIEIITISIKKINEGIGTEKDYENVGIVNIDAEVLPYINSFLKGRDIKTPNKIRFEIERFFNALNKISMGMGTISNYNAIGIKLDGKRIKIINSILKGIYERDNENLNVKEVLDISKSIVDNFDYENKLNT